MSDLPFPSAASGVWPRGVGSSSTGPSISGPMPLGGTSTGLPTVNNPNLPMNTTSGFANRPPPIPQPPRTPFPSLQQPLGTTNSAISNIYPTTSSYPQGGQLQANLAQNLAQNTQNEAYQRRLTMLEDENTDRRNATSNLTQMGAQILLGQMDVQEQILQYQLMLEQCMETLDHQNYTVNEQAEELSLLRAKMRHFEYLMDAFKLSKEGNSLLRSMSGDSCMIDQNLLCCRNPGTLPAPSTSPFFTGGPTRITASTFQPFNPRYRSPNSRATAAANLSGRQSVTPSVTNRNLPTANERPSRRLGNVN